MRKFIQITAGQWKDASGNYNHTLYGLAEDGKVYRFLVNEGWTLLRGRNEVAAPTAAPRRQQQPIIDDDVPF